MKLKKGVRLDSLCPQMLVALLVVQDVCREFGVECVITSGSEGKHSHTSLHYAGSAMDFRTLNLDHLGKVSFREAIADRLTYDFDVVLESDHLHAEYQPRRRG